MDPIIVLLLSTTILALILVVFLLILSGKANGHGSRKVRSDISKIKDQINGDD